MWGLDCLWFTFVSRVVALQSPRPKYSPEHSTLTGPWFLLLPSSCEPIKCIPQPSFANIQAPIGQLFPSSCIPFPQILNSYFSISVFFWIGGYNYPLPHQQCLVQFSSVQFSSVQSLSRVLLFATPWTAAHQASLSITSSHSLFRLMSIESVMPSNHLIFYPPAFILSQSQGFFQWVTSSHQVAKVLEFQLQHQSFEWIFRTDFL